VWTSASPLRQGGIEGGSGVEYEYFYDPAGRLIEAKTPSGSAEYAYYDNGSRKNLTLANGVRTTYTFDPLLRLDKMEHHDGQDRLMASFDYELGRSGKRLGVSESIDGATVDIDYTYDGLGRIVSAARSSGPDSDFTYDVAGNRLSRTRGGVETTYQYNALDRMESETQAGSTTSYTYDGNGNLTAKTVAGHTISYLYDSRNRLTTVYHGEVMGPPDLEYAYDFSGNRVAKADRTGSNDFSRSQFLIDDNNLTGYSQTFLELNAETQNVSRRYEYGDDLYSQVQWNGEGEGEIAFFLYDGLGTTRALSDSAGEFVQSYCNASDGTGQSPWGN
jgi:YD repeat-containing protein